MKKVLIIMMILIASTLGAKNHALTIAKENIQEKVKIKSIRNGLVSTVNLYKIKVSGSDNVTHYAFADGSRFTSKSDIMIKFKRGMKVDIKVIEARYGLRLKRKMNSGDLLFENPHANTLDIINAVLEQEASVIERVSPNRIFNMKPM